MSATNSITPEVVAGLAYLGLLITAYFLFCHKTKTPPSQ